MLRARDTQQLDRPADPAKLSRLFLGVLILRSIVCFCARRVRKEKNMQNIMREMGPRFLLPEQTTYLARPVYYFTEPHKLTPPDDIFRIFFIPS